MRIACFADLHLGVTTYGKIDPETNLNTRVLNACNSFNKMIDEIIERKIEIVVFAGDAYKNSSVGHTIAAEFNKRIRKILDKGIKVLILDGNHDVDKIETKKSPLQIYNDLRINNIIQTRFHLSQIVEIRGEKIKFVFLPTYHSKEIIEEIVHSTQYTGEPIVYIFHGAIKNSLINDWTVAQNETFIDAQIFKREGVKAVIMGHFHKHQVILEDPLVFYTGSLQRVDFSEEHQKKGFVILNVDKESVSYEFIEIESQKFHTINLNLINKRDETHIILDELDRNKDEINSSILRIRLELQKENIINDIKIYEHAYKLGASNVLDIQKKYTKTEKNRSKEINEYIDEYSVLNVYHKGKEKEKELVEMGKKIIKLTQGEEII